MAGPGTSSSERDVLFWQIAVGVIIIAGWEFAGRYSDSSWISRPSLIFATLWAWTQDDLLFHLITTLIEVTTGLFLGIVFGVVAGLVLGRSRVLAMVFRPIIIALYSVPIVALAPLIIMFLGIDMLPKIVLVTSVVFFLVFFNTFAGVERIDPDLVDALTIMGSNKHEEFRKVVFPGSLIWIFGGIKVALPYALIAATTGEMLVSRAGIGHLLSQSADRFDMTGLYAALLILMVLGMIISALSQRIERNALKWRLNEQ